MINYYLDVQGSSTNEIPPSSRNVGTSKIRQRKNTSSLMDFTHKVSHSETAHGADISVQSKNKVGVKSSAAMDAS